MFVGSRLRRCCALESGLTVALVASVLLTAGTPAQAQVGGFVQQVAGVWIGADGILRNRDVDESNKVHDAWAKALAPCRANSSPWASQDFAAATGSRDPGASPDRAPLDDEMRFLAGIQRIQYVFVYPQERDIVLAGPGEGWKLNPQGEVVGITTDRPVMWLDDLIVSLRTAQNARQTGISCSIDPSDEGIVRLRSLVPQLAQSTWNDKAEVEQATALIEDTLGMQKISVTGIPADSHFARVIVAADYKMKRLAMNFEPAPIKGLPSFLTMMKAGGSGMQNMLPRWWLEPNYESLLASPDGLAWEFRGASVKAVTEEDFVTESVLASRAAEPIRWPRSGPTT